MPPPVCSKCRQVEALEGDTWCLGCGAWEALGRELTGHWSLPGARVLASDLVVSCTRQVRAIRGFSAELAQQAAKSTGAGESRASETDPSWTTAAKSTPKPPGGNRPLPPPPPAPRCKTEDSYDEDEDEDESEDSEEEGEPSGPVTPLASGERRPPEPDHPPSGRHSHHPRSSRGSEKGRDSHRQHRDRERRSDHHGSGQRKRKRGGHRGGRKHKRLQRLVDNPHLAVHRS